jgi:hypothetical protein
MITPPSTKYCRGLNLPKRRLTPGDMQHQKLWDTSAIRWQLTFTGVLTTRLLFFTPVYKVATLLVRSFLTGWGSRSDAFSKFAFEMKSSHGNTSFFCFGAAFDPRANISIKYRTYCCMLLKQSWCISCLVSIKRYPLERRLFGGGWSCHR